MPNKPEPPAWLCQIAQEEWRRVWRQNYDRALLEAYCQSYGRWQEAEKILTESGTEVIIRDDKGQVRSVLPSPQAQLSAKYFDRMLKAAAALGLTANLKPPGKTAPAQTDTEHADTHQFFALM